MEAKIFDKIPDEAIQIREQVFIQEQGFCNEFDEIDSIASHIVLFDNEIPVATARFLIEDDSYVIGRIAVIKDYRGKHIGAEVLYYVEKNVEVFGGKCLKLHAQFDKKQFYEKQGYIAYGGIDLDEDCPHIWMSKII